MMILILQLPNFSIQSPNINLDFINHNNVHSPKDLVIIGQVKKKNTLHK
jgi:hypothetical protein